MVMQKEDVYKFVDEVACGFFLGAAAGIPGYLIYKLGLFLLY
jgi:hypothetical protein